jgi:hypothetical protein
VEAYLIPDQMCIQIAPSHPLSTFSKGKGAMALSRLCRKERNSGGGHFWACGWVVSTMGLEQEKSRCYPREHEEADRAIAEF